MKTLLGWLSKVPLIVYLVAGGLAVFAGWLALDRAHQRELGALEVEQKIKQAAADSAARVLIQRNKQLDSLVSRFGARVAQVSAAKAKTDAVAVGLKSARDSLAQTVADSLATIQELRDRGARLIQASDSAEKAHAAERATSDAALTAAKLATSFAVDSVKTAGLAALKAAVELAVTADRATRVQKGLRARLLSRCGAFGGVGGVWSGGKVSAGPTVAVGCRVL